MAIIDRLVEKLKPLKNKYSKEEIIKAVSLEYTPNIAKEVANKLYSEDDKNEKKENKEKQDKKIKNPNKIQNITLTKKYNYNELITNFETKHENFFKEVDELIFKLRQINNSISKNIIVEKNNSLNKKTKIKTKNNELETYKKELEKINSKINKLKEELEKIDDTIIIYNDQQINLKNIPRREWRKYRATGTLLIDIKHKELEKLRNQLYDIKQKIRELEDKDSKNNELHKRISEKTKIEEVTENIYEQLKKETNLKKEKPKTIEDRKKIDSIATTIYQQLQNIDKNEDKKEIKTKTTDEQKKEKEIKENKNTSTNNQLSEELLNINDIANSKNITKTNNNELNLDLDLNIDNNINISNNNDIDIVDLSKLDKKKKN